MFTECPRKKLGCCKSGDIALLPREVKMPIVPLFSPIEKSIKAMIKPINVVVRSHSAKSGTIIGILTYLGKIAISADCNIQN